jgi:hypothetical protein
MPTFTGVSTIVVNPKLLFMEPGPTFAFISDTVPDSNPTHKKNHVRLYPSKSSSFRKKTKGN